MVRRGKWSVEEDEYLKEHYYYTDLEILAKHLNRTPRAIKNRMYKLNLDKRGVGLFHRIIKHYKNKT